MSDRPNVRPPAAFRRALPWAVAALLLATVGLPSVAALGTLPAAPLIGYAHPLAANETVGVNLTDQPAFSPRYLTVPAGASVSIHLQNAGHFSHTFTLLAQPDVALSPALSPAELDAYFAANGSLANVSVASGGSGWANVSFNASAGPSSFEFVSVVPYQFQAGMYGFLNVTAVGPGLGLSENTTDGLLFVPNVLNAMPSHYPATIDVLVTNQGQFSHTFTLASQSNVSLSPGNFTQYFQQHPPLVSANVPSGGGSTVWANFTVTGPGVYQYICEIPGHFESGMDGYLYVGFAPPPPPPTPSTAVVEVWVLAGSFALLGVGAVIALIASFSGRFPRSPGSTGGHH